MASNKERIEALETRFGGMQDGLQQMELGMAYKFNHLEATIQKLSETLLSSNASSSHNNREREIPSRFHREEVEGYNPLTSSKTTRLDFPKYSGGDPTEWFSKVYQFFEFQCTPETYKVSLVSYHLEGEANQWWRWIRRTYREEDKEMSWARFEEELWARFGPTKGEDFDETLSHIRQVGTLRDYQQEFERLGNCVRGWTQKALVGTFIGGLRPEIAYGIRMFKPRTLKDAISLARMREEQLSRQRRFMRPPPPVRALPGPPQPARGAPQLLAAPVKRLTWEEMQRK